MRTSLSYVYALAVCAVVITGIDSSLAAAPPRANLLEYLHPRQQEYYHAMFDYAMTHGLADIPVPWDMGVAHGAITPNVIFINAQGLPCRRYHEQYRVGKYTQQRSGLACQRQDMKSWCRLRTTSVPTCAFEYNDTLEGRLNNLDLNWYNLKNRLQQWSPF